MTISFIKTIFSSADEGNINSLDIARMVGVKRHREALSESTEVTEGYSVSGNGKSNTDHWQNM